MMQSFKKNLSQLPLAMMQLFQQPQHIGLLSVTSCSNVVKQKRCMDTLYGVESCEDCADAYQISGPREDLQKMKEPDPFKAKDPCWQSLRRTEYKCRTDPEFLLDSFIDARKKCLSNPCAWDVPRADLTHYRPSDKLKRRYQRTWIKCVVKRRKVKMQCDCKPVVLPRRKFKKLQALPGKTNNECIGGGPDLGLALCVKPKKAESPCPRLSAKGCKPSRFPPSCKEGGRKPSGCRKRLTKYPAFSECLIDPLPDAPPVECSCLKTPMMCQVWEYYRNRKS
ncbi:uncharacterized protein LOC127565624 [Drosophila albomicans]|uniref:Uncharacterized protein LOC127565624 n=1 Tax=Drosophila albomicans TaxID=7291 RepID=A0A9C6SXX9_DROAB|nr:uncharacterized protein LOC127565624 [Drosophila albomicans]